MSRLIQATAPGKLVLAGEYAVLSGAPALATSAGVRACARVSDLAGNVCELQILHSEQACRFICEDDGAINWQPAPVQGGALVEAVIATLVSRGLWDKPAEALLIQLDSRAFFTRTSNGALTKQGLGSSAAVCVALTAALLKRMGLAPDAEAAMDAHRRLQKSRGSGIDVACSHAGGTIEFFRSVSGDPAWRVLPWPDGLHMLPVWTGRAALTTGMLDKLEQFSASEPAEFERVSGDLMTSSNYVVTQWDAGNAEVILAALADFSQQLRAFDAAADLGIWSDVHRTLGRVAAESDAVYKPSGAGAGDFGIVFSAEAAVLENLGQAYRDQGFEVPDLEIDVEGVEVREL